MQLDAKALADATADIVRSHVAQATAPLLRRIEALEARPLPDRGERGEPGPQGEPGRDGVGVRDGFLQREGVLILSLSDGTTRDLGVVVGKDGVDGRDGIDGKDGDKGEPGKDGRDGFDLESFDCVPTDERTIEMRFQQKDVLHTYELELPVLIDRGVYKAGEKYKRGDCVTWGGSLWIAQKETEAKPETDDSWRLAVKKGRDGKDSK